MNGSESRGGILAKIDTNTKVLALVTLVLEASFLGSLTILPEQQVIWALIVVATVFVVVVVGTMITDYVSIKNQGSERIEGSPLTPDSPMMRSIVLGAMHTVCRGVTVPLAPEDAQLRAFVFKIQGNALVCTHVWAPQNMITTEQVGLTIPLSTDNQDKYVVVRAYYSKAPARSEVHETMHGEHGVVGEIDDAINYVLATPITRSDGSIYGVVDFDSRTDNGRALLQSQIAENVIHHLAEHLRLIFSLSESM